MIVARKISELNKFLKRRVQGETVGFVPTMGDLHEGHLSLFRRSKRENDWTAASIFVNPAQFNQREDFLKYHRNEKEDLKKARREGVDIVFLPSEKEFYPEGFQTWVIVDDLSQELCGPFRPGHFKGVATVVAKLLNLVQPTRAYFGLKDYQQFKIIERLVRDLNLPVQVVPCPTIREKDGLALSSRNRRLSPAERERAGRIYPALKTAAGEIKSRKNAGPRGLARIFSKRLRLEKRDRLEYFKVVHPQTLLPLKTVRSPALLAAAVWIGKTRLIDNLIME